MPLRSKNNLKNSNQILDKCTNHELQCGEQVKYWTSTIIMNSNMENKSTQPLLYSITTQKLHSHILRYRQHELHSKCKWRKAIIMFLRSTIRTSHMAAKVSTKVQRANTNGVSLRKYKCFCTPHRAKYCIK